MYWRGGFSKRLKFYLKDSEISKNLKNYDNKESENLTKSPKNEAVKDINSKFEEKNEFDFFIKNEVLDNINLNKQCKVDKNSPVCREYKL